VTGSRCIGLTFINNNTEFAIAFGSARRDDLEHALRVLAGVARDFPAIDAGALREIRRHILATDTSGEPSLITTTSPHERRSPFPPFVDSTLLPLILIGQRTVRRGRTYIY